MGSAVSTKEEVIEFLAAFPGEDEGDLEELDAVLARAFSLLQDDEVDAAVFGVFERYPDEDGMGVYWSIVHGLEHRRDYEAGLVASVRRAPSQFGATMLNRLKNGGHDTCAGEDILELLREISKSSTASADTKRVALMFLDHQQRRSAEP